MKPLHDFYERPVPGIGLSQVCRHCGVIRHRRSKSVPWSYFSAPKDSLSVKPICKRPDGVPVPAYTHADVAAAHAEGYKLGLAQKDRP